MFQAPWLLSRRLGRPRGLPSEHSVSGEHRRAPSVLSSVCPWFPWSPGKFLLGESQPKTNNRRGKEYQHLGHGSCWLASMKIHSSMTIGALETRLCGIPYMCHWHEFPHIYSSDRHLKDGSITSIYLWKYKPVW